MTDILLIEDNLEFQNLLKQLLLKRGFSVWTETSGEEALDYLKIHQVKLVIADIMLKNMDGFMVCQKIREENNIPILILSAKSEKEDQLLGFTLGADDYLSKPIDLDILLAKINVLLNRHYDKILVSNSLKIDTEAYKVYLDDKLLELNAKEFTLLTLLVQNKGKTLHKQYIYNKIWGDSFSEDQTLTVHIKMLRKKIEIDEKNPTRIKTVWGIGYRYEEI